MHISLPEQHLHTEQRVGSHVRAARACTRCPATWAPAGTGSHFILAPAVPSGHVVIPILGVERTEVQRGGFLVQGHTAKGGVEILIQGHLPPRHPKMILQRSLDSVQCSLQRPQSKRRPRDLEEVGSLPLVRGENLPPAPPTSPRAAEPPSTRKVAGLRVSGLGSVRSYKAPPVGPLECLRGPRGAGCALARPLASAGGNAPRGARTCRWAPPGGGHGIGGEFPPNRTALPSPLLMCPCPFPLSLLPSFLPPSLSFLSFFPVLPFLATSNNLIKSVNPLEQGHRTQLEISNFCGSQALFEGHAQESWPYQALCFKERIRPFKFLFSPQISLLNTNKAYVEFPNRWYVLSVHI